jgi:hypothetical protein
MVKVVSNLPSVLTTATSHPEILKYVIRSGTVNLNVDFGFTRSGPPTAVTLKSFTAAYAGGNVRVAWETAAETDNFGYNVYRSTSPDGLRTRINPEIIPAVGAAQGSLYELRDTVSDTMRTYYYWLEDVTVKFETEVHGPAILRGSSPAAQKSLGSFVLPQGGLCRISYEVMKAAGLPVSTLDPAQLQVWVGGKEVAAYVHGAGQILEERDYILFYAPVSTEGLECTLRTGTSALRMDLVYTTPSRSTGPVFTGLAGEEQRVDFTVTTNHVRYLLADFSAVPVWVMDVTDPGQVRMMYGFSYVRGSNGLSAVYLSYPDVSKASCTAIGEQAIYDVPAIMKRP